MATDPERTTVDGVEGVGCELTLVISNQSFEVDPVDISVGLGKRVVVDEEFYVGGDGPAQHNWKRFVVRLPAGRHGLRVESRRGAARFHGALDLEDGEQVVVTIAFWTREPVDPGVPRGYFTVESTPPPTGQM